MKIYYLNCLIEDFSNQFIELLNDNYWPQITTFKKKINSHKIEGVLIKESSPAFGAIEMEEARFIVEPNLFLLIERMNQAHDQGFSCMANSINTNLKGENSAILLKAKAIHMQGIPQPEAAHQ